MNTKAIRLRESISIHDYKQTPQERSVRIEIADENIPDWCLSLILMNSGRLKAVKLVSDGEKPIEFRKAKKQTDRGKISWVGSEIMASLTQRELDGFILWFTQYYVRGISSVNHIDHELEGLTRGEKKGRLTLVVSRVSPPMFASAKVLADIEEQFRRDTAP